MCAILAYHPIRVSCLCLRDLHPSSSIVIISQSNHVRRWNQLRPFLFDRINVTYPMNVIWFVYTCPTVVFYLYLIRTNLILHCKIIEQLDTDHNGKPMYWVERLTDGQGQRLPPVEIERVDCGVRDGLGHTVWIPFGLISGNAWAAKARSKQAPTAAATSRQ